MDKQETLYHRSSISAINCWKYYTVQKEEEKKIEDSRTSTSIYVFVSRALANEQDKLNL